MLNAKNKIKRSQPAAAPTADQQAQKSRSQAAFR
jgi:hypothetical protein